MARSKKPAKTKSNTGDPSIILNLPRPDAWLPPSFQVIGRVSPPDTAVTAILEDPHRVHQPVQPFNITALGDGVFSISFLDVPLLGMPLRKFRLTCSDAGNKTYAHLNINVVESVVYHEVCICHPWAGKTVPKDFQAFGRVDPSISSLTVSLNGTSIPAYVPGDGSWSATFQNIVRGTYTLTATIDGTNTLAQHSNITVGGTFPSSYTITIDYPGAGSKVTSPFTASGSVNPPNSSVTVTMNGTSVSANVPGDGSWSANISIAPGTYTLTVTIDGTNVSATYFDITVDP